MLDALCVGAHPDDVEIGMGATVAKMVREGRRVAVVDLTDGEPTPKGSPEIRAAEAEAAARVLGVAERRNLSLTNRELFDTVEARKALAETIRELEPDVLFAPHPEDQHPDHVAASAIVDAARFYAKFSKTDMRGEPHYPRRIFYYGAVHLRSAWAPSFVVDTAEDNDTKMAALECYHSQFEAKYTGPGVLQAVRCQAEYWGALIGRTHGEPFLSREEIGLASALDVL